MESITIKGDLARMDACIKHLVKKFGENGEYKVVRLTVDNLEQPTSVVQARDKQTRECASVKFTLTPEGIVMVSDCAYWFDIEPLCVGGIFVKWHYEKVSKAIFMEAMSFFTAQ